MKNKEGESDWTFEKVEKDFDAEKVQNDDKDEREKKL